MRSKFLYAAVEGGWSAKVLQTRIGAEKVRLRAKPIK